MRNMSHARVQAAAFKGQQESAANPPGTWLPRPLPQSDPQGASSTD
jgi:hypothetical protein